MKLLQLNTWSCKLPGEMVKLFDAEAPDIVCLQEVLSSQFDEKVVDTIEQVTNEHPFRYQFNAPSIQFNFMHHKIRRGNMIATQFPITNTAEVWTRGSFIEDFDYINHDTGDPAGNNIPRNIAHAQIDSPEGIVHVLTLHGYHIKSHKNGNDKTIEACKELVRYASALEGPVIIAGDFNLAPISESIDIVNKAFRNLSIEYGFLTTRNHYTSKSEVCDYVFVNDAVRVDAMYMSDIIASDHNALILEFGINK